MDNILLNKIFIIYKKMSRKKVLIENEYKI